MTTGAAPIDPARQASANLHLQVGTLSVQGRITVPLDMVKPQAVLPALQSLVNAVVTATEQELAGSRKTISCKAGCGACCHQAVPISAPEAYFLHDLVEAMPQPRRDTIKARFAAIGRRLRDAGLYDRSMDIRSPDRAFDRAYFDLDLPCPFLEDENCSIHADRPLICREYLVTSPASRCSRPHDGGIEGVPIPKLSALLRRVADVDTQALTLSVALDWVTAHPDTLPRRRGTEWIEDFLGRLGKGDATTGAPPTTAAGDAAATRTNDVDIPMPLGTVSAEAMLPSFRTYTNALVSDAIAQVTATGKSISCRAGCGACCSQVVPISTIEAHRLAAVVEAMPEPRRSDVRRRFDEAEQRIAAWDRAADYERWVKHENVKDSDVTSAYFTLNIPCPFLEAGSCSIYEERPLVCREYLVTSPAENCAALGDGHLPIDVVPSVYTHLALRHLETPPDRRTASSVPLTRALRWAAEHPSPTPTLRPAQVWMDRFLDRLQRLDTFGYAVRPLQQPDGRPAGDNGVPGAHKGNTKPGEPNTDGGDTPTARTVGVDIPMPVGAVSAEEMLPSFRAYTEALIGHATAQVAANGQSVSCRAGCDACCHQLVLVSTVEARRLAALVDAMPEPRRSEIRHRFTVADQNIAAWDRAADYDRWVTHGNAEDHDIIAAYFKLDMPCPFLEASRCSIYEDRPLVCREYLVTTPAKNCDHLDDEQMPIRMVPSACTHLALRHLEAPADDGKAAAVPLTRVLRWAAEHPDPAPALHPAQTWMDRFVDRLRRLGGSPSDGLASDAR